MIAKRFVSAKKSATGISDSENQMKMRVVSKKHTERNLWVVPFTFATIKKWFSARLEPTASCLSDLATQTGNPR